MVDLIKIPAIMYIGAGLGGVFGANVGYMLCFGYNVFNGPFFPQAGVDPNPAGWVGWWLGGGALIGMAVGLLIAVALPGAWRLVFRPRSPGEPHDGR